MADGVADAPNRVAEAADIEDVGPQIVDIVEKIVPKPTGVKRRRSGVRCRWRAVQEQRGAPDSHQRMHHESSSEGEREVAADYCCKPEH